MKKSVKILRVLLIVTGGIMCLFYALPTFFGSRFNLGAAAGLVFFGGMLLWGVFYKRIHLYFSRKRKNRAIRAVTDIICILTAAGLLICTAVSAAMINAARRQPPPDTDIIVLGCRVNENGPSRMLRTRIEAAFEYLEKNPGASAVLSGGRGDDEPESEAECMYKELVKMGIEENRLIKEDKSTSTRENVAFSKKLLKNGGEDGVAIVTDVFHEYRASLICADCGIRAYAVGAHTAPGLVPVYWTREIAAVIAEILF